MTDLTVKWITNKEADALDEKDNIGGMGGFFNMGMRWKDYLDSFIEEIHPHLEALRESIIESGIWEDGGWHQNAEEPSVPYWSDGKFGTYSFRAWGDLMAAVWSEHYNRDYCYMSFYYMDVPDKPTRESDNA